MTDLEVMKKFVSRYRFHPELYIREVIGVDKLEEWQIDLCTAITSACKDSSLPKRFAVRSGHGIGKTAFMAWLDKWFMATRVNPRLVTTANTENQLSTKTWPELAKWNRQSKDGTWFEWSATKFVLKSAKETWFSSSIPWTRDRSEAFAGTHAKSVMLKFDEASAIDDVIWEVAEGSMTTEDCWWFVFGNPTRNTGRFAECWGKYRHRWHLMEIDSRNVSIADQEQIGRWIEDEGEDSDFVRVRVRGLPPISSMLEFIGAGDVEKCVKYQPEGYESSPKVWGVDIARFGDNKNVVIERQGRACRVVATWFGIDGMQTASRLAELIQNENPDAVFMDEGGVGGPVLDRVRVLCGDKVIGVNFGSKANDEKKYFNRRAEMWGTAREAIRAGTQIPDVKELKADLCGPLYSFSPKEQIKLERKEDMQKRGLASPDYGDGYVLTYAMPVSKEPESAIVPSMFHLSDVMR